MRYSDDVREEVIARTDIVSLIGEDVRLKRSGSNYWGLCPFHPEKTPSFSVSPSKQIFYCFGCHAGGNAITYMMEYHNYSYVEALKILAGRAGISLPEESLTEEQKAAYAKKERLLEMYKKAAGFYYYRLKAEPEGKAMRYLKGRGLSDETIRRFGLGYADRFGDRLYRYLKKEQFEDELLMESGLFRFDEKKGVSDQFWNRVMFPISDTRGRVIGFGGRVMGEGEPKYLNSPESYLFNKRKNLYALNYARSSRRGNIILCEGYMDVITMHQAGFTNACASLGTALTPEQSSLLRRFTSEVLLMYDSDTAGTSAALRAIPILKEAGITPRVVNLAPCKDPDEFIKAEGGEALEERIRGAENAFLFELRQLSTGYRRSDPAQWTEFQHEIARKLVRIPEELERENYLTAACNAYGISPDSMRRLLGRVAAAGTPAETYVRPVSGREKKAKEDGFVTTQKLMLTYLANYPEAYEATKGILGPGDFTDDFCRKVAEEIYSGLAGGRLSEASVIGLFPDSADQRKAAELFHTEIPVANGTELDRAFTDTVVRMLRQSNENMLKYADITDLEVYSRYIERKKKTEEFSGGKLFHLPFRENIGSNYTG